MLTASALLLGQEIELPSWVSAEQVSNLQQLTAAITTGGSQGTFNVATAQSYPLIGVTDYYSNPNYSRFDGSDYSVVVIDTGIDIDHPAFGPDGDFDGISDRIVYQYDFADDDMDASDNHGHGTHVAGIVAGAAPGVNMIALKVFASAGGSGEWADIEAALQWVIANAEEYNIASVNISIVDQEMGNYTAAITDETDDDFDTSDEMAAIAGMGIGIAASAGNRFFEFQATPGVAYPAADENAIAVGATWDRIHVTGQTILSATDFMTVPDRIAAFSQRHESLLHVFAPGARITNAAIGGGTEERIGTSMAAPHVAAAIALAQQISEYTTGARLSRQGLIELFQETGASIVDGDDENDNVVNTGHTFSRLDIFKMANRLLPPGVLDVIVSDESPDSEGDTVQHPDFHFNTVDGSGTQLMTVPVGGADTLEVVFSEMVTSITIDSLRFVGIKTAHKPVAESFTAPSLANNFTATWNFTDAFISPTGFGDYFLLSLSDEITDLDGNALDGDWMNPGRIFENPADLGEGFFDENDDLVSEFPSGNGTAGEDFNFLVTIFPGDVDGNLTLDTTDLLAVLNHFFAPGSWIDGDYDGNGTIDTTDLLTVLNHFFAELGAIEWRFNLDNENDGVDQDDLNIWDTYDPNNLAGDFNGDGFTDTLDRQLLENLLDLAFQIIG
jgi:hypothetical protein